MKDYDLIVIMPVFNEQDCIGAVVEGWVRTIKTMGIRYAIHVYNDGSTDATAKVLERFADSSTVRVINKPNAGHGPTILSGYKMAVSHAEWLFQCDSDDEVSPDAFPALWNRRKDYDALFGYRANRVQSRGRALISSISRFVVTVLCGGQVKDVNTPFRLMRADLLESFIHSLPDDTFAPNIIISGELNRRTRKILNVPVQHNQRRTGQVSIVKWKLWKMAAVSLMQTIHYFYSNRNI